MECLDRSTALEGVSGQFVCSWSAQGRGAALVCPSGEHDIAGEPQFTQAMSEAARHARLVVVDLRRGLTFMDCAGLRAIVKVSLRAREHDRRLLLIRRPAQVHRLFVLTGVGDDLEILELDRGEPPVQVLLHLAQPAQVP